MSWIRWYILLGVCSVFLLLKGTGSRKKCGFKKWNHLWSGCWVSPFGTTFLLLSRTCHLFEKMYCLIENHFHLGRKTHNACKCQLRIIARSNYGFCLFNHWLNDICSMARPLPVNAKSFTDRPKWKGGMYRWTDLWSQQRDQLWRCSTKEASAPIGALNYGTD